MHPTVHFHDKDIDDPLCGAIVFNFMDYKFEVIL